MLIEACGYMWISMDRYWFIGICGCQWIGSGVHGGVWVSVDIIGCMYNRKYTSINY